MKFRQLLFKAIQFFVGSPSCRIGTYIVVHAILIFCVVKRVQTYTRNGTEMTQKAHELKKLITDREKWNQRSLWVSQEVPRFIRHEEAKGQLVKVVNQEFERGGGDLDKLEIRHQQRTELTASSISDSFEKVAVELSFNGTEKEVISFIHRLQTPKNFVGVDHLAIDLTEYGELSCEVRVTQWFLPPWRQVENVTFESES